MEEWKNYTPGKIPPEKQAETISVIVPVYNVGRYLSRTIEGIRNQTYRNLEIILVDDGSTDDSPEICDLYAGRDSRIKVLHRANGGAGSARNSGMKLATGEYLIFADGDDWMEADMYERMLSAIWETKADIAVCRMQYVFEDRIWDGSTGAAGIFYGSELLETYIACNGGWADGIYLLENGVCNKLYRRSLAEGLSFSADRRGEEIPFTTRLFYRAQKGVYLDTAYYHYFSDRPDSLMHAEYSAAILEEELAVWNDRSAFLNKSGREDLARTSDFFIYDRLLSTYLELRKMGLTHQEEALVRTRIKKAVREGRRRIAKAYSMSFVRAKKRIRMKVFWLSPRLFILASVIDDFVYERVRRMHKR